MASIILDATQVQHLSRDLLAAALGAGPAIETAVDITLAAIEDDAKTRVEVVTGTLRDSITHETHRSGTNITGEVGPEEWYGHFLEGGTSTRGPRPYMGPAYDIQIVKLPDLLARAVIGTL